MNCIYNCTSAAAGVDWPAWIQAVGSVAGIFVAVAVAWWPQYLSRKESQRKNHEERVALYVLANRVVGRFEKLIAGLISDAEDAQRSASSFRVSPMKVPDEVRGLEAKLHLVSDAGGPCFTAINQFEDAQRIIKFEVISHSETTEYLANLNNARSNCNTALGHFFAFLSKQH